MNESLATLVEEFAVNPQGSGRAMREMSECDPGGFLAQSVDILRKLPKGQGLDYVITLLAQSDYLLDILWHQDLLSEAQAVDLASYAQRLDRQLSVRLGRRLGAAPSGTSVRTVGRVLEILAATADAMLLPLLLPFTNHPNHRIRSKVALMIGRVNHNAKWVESRLEDSDERVRANAVESLWNVDTPEARALLWKAAGDPHHRVAANAMLGLYRLGEPAGIERLVELSGKPEPARRAASAWAMGECRDPRFLPRLRDLEQDHDADVTRNATKAADKIEASLRELSENPPLRLRVFVSRWHNDGRRELWVVANTEQGLTLPGLRPTCFAIFEDERLVTNYAIQESPHHKALVVGFALPRPAPGTTDCFAAALADSMRYKHRLDQWALVRFITTAAHHGVEQSQVHERLFGVEFSAPEQEAEQPAAPVKEMLDCLISNSPATLRQKLEQTACRHDCAAGLDLAVRSLLTAVSHRPGTKHVILLAGSSADCQELPGCSQILGEQAAVSNIMIHAVAGPQVSDHAYKLLRKLAHKTGGRALRALSDTGIADTVSTLCLSLAHHYRIVCKPAAENNQPSRTMIRVQTTNASGYHEVEGTQGLDEPPARAHPRTSQEPAEQTCPAA